MKIKLMSSLISLFGPGDNDRKNNDSRSGTFDLMNEAINLTVKVLEK